MEHAKHSLLPLYNYMHTQLKNEINHQPIILKHILFTHIQLPASVVWDEKNFQCIWSRLPWNRQVQLQVITARSPMLCHIIR